MRMSDEKKSPDVKQELSSLWQSALGQIDEIRDVIVRGSHAGKAKLDAQLLKRQRDKLLMQIGEALLADVKSGATPLPPSCDELAKRVDELERQLAEAEAEADKAFARVNKPGE
jgi:hypothetical protein